MYYEHGTWKIVFDVLQQCDHQATQYDPCRAFPVCIASISTTVLLLISRGVHRVRESRARLTPRRHGHRHPKPSKVCLYRNCGVVTYRFLRWHAQIIRKTLLLLLLRLTYRIFLFIVITLAADTLRDYRLTEYGGGGRITMENQIFTFTKPTRTRIIYKLSIEYLLRFNSVLEFVKTVFRVEFKTL